MSYVVFSLVLIPLLLLLGKKWEIYPERVFGWTAAMWLLGCGSLLASGAIWPSMGVLWRAAIALAQSGVLTIVALGLLFYRDPDRTPTDIPDVILSPADGRVLYVTTVPADRVPFAVKKGCPVALAGSADGGVPSGPLVQIGIGMNFTDVHVNRSPVTGEVCAVEHIAGKFRSLKYEDALAENERCLTRVRGSRGEVVVAQIASRLVRRIVSYVQPGDELTGGQRIGAIVFGSQVDVLVPMAVGLKVAVAVDERVKAGVTVLASYRDEA